ncbi:MAG: NTP transferase domain-containing protein, partial [Actinobacteria bacterium]|nr:NTP transferase domain-containing protein [Actinomycetota bacterium]
MSGSDNSRLAVVVLGAGEGKRMRSDTPKALHPVCGRPMIEYVLDGVASLGAGEVVLVVGPRADDLRNVAGKDVRFAEQGEALGTGHAVKVALENLDEVFEEILVLPGDSPLIRGETLQGLVGARRDGDAAAALLTAEIEDPGGYGRVLRDASGEVKKIVEEADATDAERAV